MMMFLVENWKVLIRKEWFKTGLKTLGELSSIDDDETGCDFGVDTPPFGVTSDLFPSNIEWDLTNGRLSKLLELWNTQV